MVRSIMGTQLVRTQLDDSHEQWVVVDALLKRERPDLGEYSIQYCNPARPATYIRGAGRRRRWELMLLPGEDEAQVLQPERLWALLSPWITLADADIERAAVYAFHSVVASDWRRGHLLLAGDAAHQTPPFLGQGMCAGLRDAANLAWKLTDVIAGRATESLLDTYESERAPHVREYIETAVRLGALIQTTDLEVARARDIAMLKTPQSFKPLKPSLGPGAHDASLHSGQVGEQPALASGKRLDDEVGWNWALVCSAELKSALDSVPRAVRTVVADGSPQLEDWLQRLSTSAVLVRPDRYIFGTADDARSAAALLSRAGFTEYRRPEEIVHA
jgi:3-(3-hydroxy-phenyl)propionate hydroxylase